MQKKTTSLLVLTPHFNPGLEKQDLGLVKLLRSRGYVVCHAAITDNYPGKNFPGFSEKSKLDEEFLSVGTLWVDSSSNLRRYIRDCDVLVVMESKWASSASDYAKKKNKLVIQYKAISSGDFYDCNADFYCVPSEGYLKYQSINFGKDFLPEQYRITGVMQYDAAATLDRTKDAKDRFFNKYELNPNKATVLWLPDSPANHNEYYKSIYVGVCKIATESGFNVLIKGHPWDYIHRKSHSTYRGLSNKSSWEILTPTVAVCDPEDLYEAIYYSDVGVAVMSTVFMEFPLFRKPMLLVNRHEWVLSRSPGLLDKVNLSLDKERIPGLHKLDVHKKIIDVLEAGALGTGGVTSPAYYRNPQLEFVGMDINLDELGYVLQNKVYDGIDERIYDAYVENWCYKNDGESCKRVANAVDNYVANNLFWIRSLRSSRTRYMDRIIRRLSSYVGS